MPNIQKVKIEKMKKLVKQKKKHNKLIKARCQHTISAYNIQNYENSTYSNIDYELDLKLLHRRICLVLDTIPPRQKDIISYLYVHNKTIGQVAKMFGVTYERIRQIKQKALAKLQHPNRKTLLKGFLNIL